MVDVFREVQEAPGAWLLATVTQLNLTVDNSGPFEINNSEPGHGNKVECQTTQRINDPMGESKKEGVWLKCEAWGSEGHKVTNEHVAMRPGNEKGMEYKSTAPYTALIILPHKYSSLYSPHRIHLRAAPTSQYSLTLLTASFAIEMPFNHKLL